MSKNCVSSKLSGIKSLSGLVLLLWLLCSENGGWGAAIDIQKQKWKIFFNQTITFKLFFCWNKSGNWTLHLVQVFLQDSKAKIRCLPN